VKFTARVVTGDVHGSSNKTGLSTGVLSAATQVST